MMEGSGTGSGAGFGAGSVLVTNGSGCGSRWPQKYGSRLVRQFSDYHLIVPDVRIIPPAIPDAGVAPVPVADDVPQYVDLDGNPVQFVMVQEPQPPQQLGKGFFAKFDIDISLLF